MNVRMPRFFAIPICFFSSIAAQEDLSLTNLDSYLQQHNFYLSPLNSDINEGYCSDAQRQVFREDLQKSPYTTAIAEIGFNAGHSCETFLESLDHVKVTSFDIGSHSYTNVGVEFMQKKYLDRFEFIKGNSNHTVKAYAESSGKKFDLIYIDGCHDFNCALNDIYNCQRLAHENTIVWIDDYAPYGVKGIVDYCVEQGLIKIIQELAVTDHTGPRLWVKAKYESLSEAEKYFSDIYANGLWGRDKDGQAISGPGSTLSQGLPFIQYVQNLVDTHEIRSVVDLGCGDWVLAKEINWRKSDYLGIDVVKSLVQKNQALYGSDTIHFLQLDAGSEEIPAGDLLICKDVLMHLPDVDVFHILAESKKFKYCLFINDINPFSSINTDIPTYGFRALDLTKPPFNLIPHKEDYYISGHAKKQVLLIKH
jgi:SAM-dependent methyltransferase